MKEIIADIIEGIIAILLGYFVLVAVFMGENPPMWVVFPIFIGGVIINVLKEDD